LLEVLLRELTAGLKQADVALSGRVGANLLLAGPNKLLGGSGLVLGSSRYAVAPSPLPPHASVLVCCQCLCTRAALRNALIAAARTLCSELLDELQESAGSLQNAWASLIHCTKSTANVHGELADRIMLDLVTPLEVRSNA
jgi:hypothetical protein